MENIINTIIEIWEITKSCGYVLFNLLQAVNRTLEPISIFNDAKDLIKAILSLPSALVGIIILLASKFINWIRYGKA